MQAPPEPNPLARPEVSGGFIEGVPPVPIPNTEVKPVRCDGTARFPCGRVGRCRNIIETCRRPILGTGAFLFLVVHPRFPCGGFHFDLSRDKSLPLGGPGLGQTSRSRDRQGVGPVVHDRLRISSRAPSGRSSPPSDRSGSPRASSSRCPRDP